MHLTLIWQLPIIGHKIIDRHRGRLWKRQCPLDKLHDDDDDDDDIELCGQIRDSIKSWDLPVEMKSYFPGINIPNWRSYFHSSPT